jgi:hypothetical protein
VGTCWLSLLGLSASCPGEAMQGLNTAASAGLGARIVGDPAAVVLRPSVCLAQAEA